MIFPEEVRLPEAHWLSAYNAATVKCWCWLLSEAGFAKAAPVMTVVEAGCCHCTLPAVQEAALCSIPNVTQQSCTLRWQHLVRVVFRANQRLQLATS